MVTIGTISGAIAVVAVDGGWWTGSPGSSDNPYELPEVIVTPS